MKVSNVCQYDLLFLLQAKQSATHFSFISDILLCLIPTDNDLGVKITRAKEEGMSCKELSVLFT